MKQRSKESIHSLILGVILCLVIGGCKKEKADNSPLIFSANGNITARVDEFRALLGALNSTTGQTTGRREINWDGVPDALDGTKLPGDFFNPTDVNAQETLQRGVVYAGADNAMVSQTNFSEVNANASGSFASFSGNKTFAVVNATLWPVTFQVAGENRAAATKAFGAVFVDVDKDNSTFIEFFNGSASLGRFFVPAHNSTTGFSFLGVSFPDAVITEVHIGHEGRLIDGEKDITQGGTKDLIVLDDFIYGEPLSR